VIRDAGTIVAERDELAWTAAIEQLLQRPELRREYASRGLERASASFAWPVVARAHLAWFEEVLAR
jgi:glycosyltransferase involved in cell wall biosynthesis